MAVPRAAGREERSSPFGALSGKVGRIVSWGRSTIVKRYLGERGSREAIALTAESEMIATPVISRAEVAAGFAKAVRTAS
jgi:hypothetical protein